MTRDIRVILVTTPAGDEALELARALVRERCAACVNVVPRVRSVYRWDGGVEEGDESLLVIKAPAGAVPRLRERVAALHPYDVPEFLVLPVEGGLPAYLDWVSSSVSGGG
jgi:periplasmic divalent cation tolerance protein